MAVIRGGSIRSAKKAAVATEAAAAETANQQAEADRRGGLRSALENPGSKGAKRYLGYTARDAYNPGSQMHSQVEKQINRAGGNPNHGLAITRLGDELMGRVNRSHVNDPAAVEALVDVRTHLAESARHIRAHQVATDDGDHAKAAVHLVQAAARVASAVNSIPASHREILSDDWKHRGYDKATEKDVTVPWKVPAKENLQEHNDFVSLKNVHSDLNDIVASHYNATKDALQGTATLPAPPTLSSKTKMVVNRSKRPIATDVDAVAEFKRKAVEKAGNEDYLDTRARKAQDIHRERAQAAAEAAMEAAANLHKMVDTEEGPDEGDLGDKTASVKTPKSSRASMFQEAAGNK